MTARRSDSGLTLIELMVAVTVLGIVSGVLFKFLSTGSLLFSSMSSVAEAQMSGRFSCAMLEADTQHAGLGTTANCDTDPMVGDKASSCMPWSGGVGMRAVAFDDDASSGDYGSAAINNPQYSPDDVWFMMNPYPGRVLDVTSRSGNLLNLTQPADVDDATAQEIVESPVVLLEQRGAKVFRAGGVFTSNGAGSWTLTVSPDPSSAINPMGGYGGSDARVSAVRWVRYHLAPDPDGGGVKIDLVREEWGAPGDADPLVRDIVADDVIDFQASFCVDPNLVAPPDNCGITDDAYLAANLEAIRTATYLIRVRQKGEDSSVYADPSDDLGTQRTWYDLDGIPGNGAARVRTLSCTVAFPNVN